MCVVGQYVYVAEWAGDCVSVFTTEGGYVTSFGQSGGNEGDFKCPTGVWDGFVYVCDGDNNRVQEFMYCVSVILSHFHLYYNDWFWILGSHWAIGAAYKIVLTEW